jgi:glycosyltransferase involved in cell wall biosynthesis
MTPGPKIRVLQLMENFKVGGAEKVGLLLARHLNRERFEVIPCALRQTGPLEEEMRAAGIDYRVLGIHRRSILTGPLFATNLRCTIQALANTLSDLSIDIIHAHLTECTILAVLAAHRVGSVRVCGTAHSVVLSAKRGRLSPRGFLFRAVAGRILSHTDRIIACSEEVMRALKLHMGVSSDRVLTIPNGVEENDLLNQASRSSLRHMLGIPEDRPIVVSVGRLSVEKGFPDLQDALASIQAQQRPLTLIVGDGPKRAELESRTKAMGLDRDILFLGYRRDVPAVLAASDLFVLASHWEGLPLGLLEAMAAGLATVVTAVGGNPQVVAEGVSGLLVPAGDKQALGQAISALLQDPLRRERMGQAARQRFERHFSMKNFIRKHEHLYEEILFGSPLASSITV